MNIDFLILVFIKNYNHQVCFTSRRYTAASSPADVSSIRNCTYRDDNRMMNLFLEKYHSWVLLMVDTKISNTALSYIIILLSCNYVNSERMTIGLVIDGAILHWVFHIPSDILPKKQDMVRKSNLEQVMTEQDGWNPICGCITNTYVE